LGALINGVFLLALCFSIGAEALQRLFEAPEVGQPQLVVIVGSLGLLSNIVGLFLFHDHGHSHGGHSHSHGPAAAEEGHSHSVSHKAAKPSAIKTKHSHGSSVESDERSPLLANGNASQSKPVAVNGGESPFTDEDEDAVNDLLGHPARTREAIVRQAYGAGFGTPRNADGFGHRRSLSVQSQHRRKNSGDANTAKSPSSETPSSGHVHSHDHAEGDGHTHEHDHPNGEQLHDHDGEDHDHSHEESHGGGGGGHGHSHGNMNMQGVFLHVLGDALGNVGVIVSGLIIWLTKSPYRFYSDPIISLVITVIIFSSALPLVRSASFILLQGTPSHVPLEKVHSAILRIPNVVSVHDLHIWSLSESKLVASMHILVSSQDEFAKVSNEVRKLLHRFGVHSSTIQPELLDGSTKPGSTMSRQGSTERLYLPNGDHEISVSGACY
jgi:zinc transporter 1